MTRPMGYVHNLLDRSNVERESGTVADCLADPAALRVIIAGDTVLLRAGPERPSALLSLTDLVFAPAATESVLLGSLDGRPVVASLVAEMPTGADLTVRDLRSIAVEAALASGEIGMLAQARSLLQWHATHRFCARCGGATAPGAAGGRRDCSACGAQHFPRTDPVAIMLVSRGDLCLLGRQRHFAPGMYSALAGFISPGETIEDAVRREVLEEAGVAVGAVRYMASQPWPFPSSLMIGCLGEALGDDLTVDHEELEDARWFTRDEARLMLARTHPDGLMGPAPMAIAHHLLVAFAESA